MRSNAERYTASNVRIGSNTFPMQHKRSEGSIDRNALRLMRERERLEVVFPVTIPERGEVSLWMFYLCYGTGDSVKFTKNLNSDYFIT